MAALAELCFVPEKKLHCWYQYFLMFSGASDLWNSIRPDAPAAASLCAFVFQCRLGAWAVCSVTCSALHKLMSVSTRIFTLNTSVTLQTWLSYCMCNQISGISDSQVFKITPQKKKCKSLKNAWLDWCLQTRQAPAKTKSLVFAGQECQTANPPVLTPAYK